MSEELFAIENNIADLNTNSEVHITKDVWNSLYEKLKQHRKNNTKFPADHSIQRIVLNDSDLIGDIDLPEVMASKYPDASEYVLDDPSLYQVVDGVIYSRGMNPSLLLCPPGKTGTFQIPEGVSHIELFAFYKAKISEVVFPDSLEFIEKAAFYSCDNLTSLSVPAAVKYLGGAQSWANPFVSCHSLQSVTVDRANTCFYSTDDGLLYFEDGRLLCCPAGKAGVVSLPESCYALAESAFEGCCYVDRVSLPAGMRYFGRYTFMDCTFASISIPASVKRIGTRVFCCCENLRDIYFHAPQVDIDTDDGDPFALCSKELCFHGKAGSRVEEYAKNNGFRFCDLSDEG